MYYAGVDIGSTAAKAALFNEDKLLDTFVIPTGWNSLETSKLIMNKFISKGIEENDIRVVATGYGRVSVPYASKTITEITCHGRGAAYISGEDCTVIDIGGQDTKVITVEKAVIKDFIMNDKCSAGTGKFIEIMANTLGVDIDTLCRLAEKGGGVTISSMCTVFAESEIISLIGRGEKKENIAYAIVNSIVSKVSSLCKKHSDGSNYFLTGGLCECSYIVKSLSDTIGKPVKTTPMARYAGAIGAALLAKNIRK